MSRLSNILQILQYSFWIGCSIGLVIPFWSVCKNLYEKMKANSMSFTIDSAYLDFNTSFPSISLCQVFNGEKNWELSEKYFGDVRDKRIDEVLTQITFFNGVCYSCALCQNELKCPSNITEILQKFRASCENLIKQCSWNDEIFDCCEGFRPLATETGTCYTINSALTTPKFGKELFCNQENGPGKLKMMVTEDVQIFIHNPNDVPYANVERDLKDTILWGSTKEIIVKVTEIINDETVVTIPIAQRHCRFSWEREESNIYDIYSFSTCQTSCYNEAQVKFCNCTHHLMPRNPRLNIPLCDFSGLVCLTENFGKITEIRKTCTNCLSSCEEYEYRIIYNSNEEMGNDEGTDITVSMLDLPTYRYFRRTVKTDLDFVISIGGIFGLFFGVSFISIFEIIYKIVLFIKQKLLKKKKTTENIQKELFRMETN